jgi:hypothetical protein
MGVGARPRRARYDRLCARLAGGTIDKFELMTALNKLGKPRSEVRQPKPEAAALAFVKVQSRPAVD